MARRTGDRKQLRTKLKLFDIEAWKKMNAARDKDPKLFVQIRNTLTEQNRPYAVVLAAKCARANPHCDLQDLIQAACLGLAVAIERFDPTRAGFKLEDFDPKKGGFTSYAAHFIKSEMREVVRKERVVSKSPRDDLRYDDKKIVWDFVKKHGREPVEGEVELPPNVSFERLMRAAAPPPAVLPLERPKDYQDGRDGAQCELPGFIDACEAQGNPESELLRKESEGEENAMLDCLTAIERHVVIELVMNSRPPKKVSEAMRIPMRELLTIKHTALAKLRLRHAPDRA